MISRNVWIFNQTFFGSSLSFQANFEQAIITQLVWLVIYNIIQAIRDRLAFGSIKACLRSCCLIIKLNFNTFWSSLWFQTKVEQLLLWMFDVVFSCRRGMSSRRLVLRGNGQNALMNWRRNIREQSFRTLSRLILFTRRISYRWIVFSKLLLSMLFFFQVLAFIFLFYGE